MNKTKCLLTRRIKPFVFIVLCLFYTSTVMAQFDNCAGAIPLTIYNATCGGATAGTTVGATQSLPGCSGTADDDVWYSFVASGGTPTITVISTGGAGRIQDIVFEVFSGSCGSLTSVLCRNATTGTSTEASGVPNLINGNTYYVRVHSAANGTGQGTFTICITRPNPPANDNCATATVLTPGATCVNGTSQASGNLVNATNSGIAGTACGGSTDDDVWYSFVAAYNMQTITVSSIGSSIALTGLGIGGKAVMEIFSSSTGTCGGILTPIACGQESGTNLIGYANNLTVGNTYFIRVYSTNSVSLSANGGFTICILNPPLTAPVLSFGKSFRNVTKGLNGGTVEPGDVLELRASVVLRPTSVLDSCAFYDNIPAGTTYVPGTLAVLTNEGKIYKGFTDASGDDEGTFNSGAITVNMGFNTGDNQATAFRRGRLRNANRPVVGGSSCVMLVSYQVTVTAPLNTQLSLGGGTFTYSLPTSPTTIVTQTYNANNVKVYTNTGLCVNASGVNVLNSGLTGDFTGTFGSGNTINRIASPNVPAGYIYTTQVGSKPQDFEYAISNNTSNNQAGYSTVNTWPKPESPATHRIFGVFDVIGDHTGATNQLLGNPAADTTNGGVGGYMLLVNSSYNLDTAFKYPISGLCANTYYEISFWVRNICSRCGADSTGKGASGVTVPAGYIPTDIGDSSGVYPNLSFSIDDVNHYTTGSIKYTGEWVKKGFVFLTGPAQTSIVFSINNNAPGGGGNDWALDDISLATCTPLLSLIPNGNSQVCFGNQVDMTCTVSSYFDNYTYYEWEQSTDGGANWTSTGVSGTGTPVLVSGSYQYVATYPSFLADSSVHMKMFRIKVATTSTNLSSTDCSFAANNTLVVMVNNCSEVLKTELLNFDGSLVNGFSTLKWNVDNESSGTIYEIERSDDNQHFKIIGKLPGKAPAGFGSSYTFVDPNAIAKGTYYRIKIKEGSAGKYSKVIYLDKSLDFSIKSIVNPFRSTITLEVITPQSGNLELVLMDSYGRIIKKSSTLIETGLQTIRMTQLDGIAQGTYTLRIQLGDRLINKRVVKINN